jgi:hypothetical protein
MSDILWTPSFSPYHASIFLPQDDEFTSLMQLSELQREEIIGVCIFLPIVSALDRFMSHSTQLRCEIDELDEINHETEEQVSWLCLLFNSLLISFLHSSLTVDPRPSS